jgi:hypothetical protein
MTGLKKVAKAAARLTEPNLPDHLVEGFAEMVAAWLRALVVNHAPARPSVPCQPWCLAVKFGYEQSCGGECWSDGAWVAATRGPAVLTDEAVKLARVEANACLNEHGEVAVHISIHGPINDRPGDDTDRAAWAYMSPTEARTIGRLLLAEADLVDPPEDGDR